MKRLIVACVVAGLAWSGHWFWSAHQLRQQTETWFQTLRAAGWEARYEDLAILGFPNRLDATFTGLTLSDPARAVRWQAPFLQVFRLIYKPEHLILIWPEDQTVTTQAGTTTVTDQGLRASLVLDEGEVLRSNLEAQTLTLSTPGGVFALSDLTAALTHIDASTYRLAINATGEDGADRRAEEAISSGISADATLTLERPVSRNILTAGPPQPTRINLRLAEYRLGDAWVKLSGDLELDAEGFADGILTLQTKNWRALLAAAETRGDLPQSLASTLNGIFTRLAGPQDDPQALDLVLEVSDGALFLDTAEVGQLPPLLLP